MRPVDMPPKPSADDQKYRYRSPIEGDVKASDLTDRALDAKVTITTRELMAVAPDVRRQVKELISSKKISANIVEVDNSNAYLTGCCDPKPDSSAVYLNTVKDKNSAAAPSLPLRVIFPMFAPGVC